MSNCELLLQSISHGVLMLDKDAYIKYVNPAVTSITGYTSLELINQPLSILYGSREEKIRVDYELDMSLKNGLFSSEGWKVKKDGMRFWAEHSFKPVYDEHSNFIGFSCLFQDTSERKEREMDLRFSEERYRLLVDGVKEYSIFMLDVNGCIQTWNEGARHIKGYSINEIIGKHFSIFYTAKDIAAKKPEREIEVAIATGKYEEEGWRVRKNGSVFWANIVLTSLYNDLNQLIGFSKVTRDLTQRKEDEERLMQSEERYRSLVEQVTDYGIFMMDEKGRIISWNEGAKRMKGYTPGEIIGKYFSIFYPQEDIMDGKPARELKIAKQEGKYEEEGWRLRKDGSAFWANVVITAVYNPEGILIGYSKVTRDLTGKKEAEKALKDSYDRYRRLADELKATNTELSFANEELEQFTSIVSHDLQEPVRTIKSFLQLIEKKLQEGQHEHLGTYITKSLNAANRMKSLIQNLLNYSQLSRDEMVEEVISVEELVQLALLNLRNLIETTGALITIESKVDVIRGNPTQLVQLIQNLVSNAIKFTDARAPRIKIRCHLEHGYPKFSVSDNGIGIAESDLGKVFDIFRRLNTEKDYPGTGIGLSICKKIVDRHKGRIWPESQPGKGTTFYFTLNES
jgi:PAS domain S-box-containing protein